LISHELLLVESEGCLPFLPVSVDFRLLLVGWSSPRPRLIAGWRADVLCGRVF